MKNCRYEELLKYNQQITEILMQCSGSDWNGYGAAPINPTYVAQMQQFVEALPDDIPYPEPLPISDGTLDLEWMTDDVFFIVGMKEKDVFFYAIISRDGNLPMCDDSIKRKDLIEILKETVGLQKSLLLTANKLR